MKTVYHNRLPHIAPVGASFFVTFRLADSLPQAIIYQIQNQYEKIVKKILDEKKSGYQNEIIRQRKLLFKKYEHQLDDNPYGECHLKNETIAQIIKDKLHQYDNQLYRLIAYCIMPNHVHVLFETSIQLENETEFLPNGIPKNYVQLDKIMKLIKGGSSVAANRVLGRKGTFWQKDSYDHFVRNEKEYNNIVVYILNNPVKARMVADRKDWPNNYISP